jgi:IS30 family transposase
VIDYNRTVTTFHSPPGPAAAGSRALDDKPIDPRFLSLTEREMIRDLTAGGSSLRAIGQAMTAPKSLTTTP